MSHADGRYRLVDGVGWKALLLSQVGLLVVRERDHVNVSKGGLTGGRLLAGEEGVRAGARAGVCVGEGVELVRRVGRELELVGVGEDIGQ